MIFGFYDLTSRTRPPVIRRLPGWLAAFSRGGANFAGQSWGSGGDRASSSGLFQDRGAGKRIAYDGDICNYSELRLELEHAGVKFTSDLESELVLRAYARWGAGCQNRLNGEWSFAVLDEVKNTLFCSRDRFGLRPFYYFYNGEVLVFSSKIKPLLFCPLVKKDLNNGAVFDYLVLNRANLPDETFFKEIGQLQPGCCLSLSPKKGLLKKRYYRPAYNTEIGRFDEKALKKHSSEFFELFITSVRARMRPPYPLGSTLSGGMDSSSIVSMADRLTGRDATGWKKLRVFSVAWKNEAKYIKEVAGRVGLSHCWIRPAEAERTSWAEVKRVVASAERPLNLTTFFGEIAFLKTAKREKIKVMLDGGGGDELLAGYPEKSQTSG